MAFATKEELALLNRRFDLLKRTVLEHIGARTATENTKPSRREIVRSLVREGYKGRVFARGLDERHFPGWRWGFPTWLAAWDAGDPHRHRIENIRCRFKK